MSMSTAQSYYRSLQEYTAPSVEPLSLADAKLHCHVTHSAEDDMIEDMIVVARREVERATGLSLIDTVWAMRMDSFPAGDIILPRGPLDSVTSVAYVDANGDAATMTATTEYIADLYSVPPRIYLAPTASWPSTYGEPNDVTVTWKAGYGAAATAVPVHLIHAIKLMVGHLYLHRERFASGEAIEELPAYANLIRPERIEFTF